jgi:hypothetical protein
MELACSVLKIIFLVLILINVWLTAQSPTVLAATKMAYVFNVFKITLLVLILNVWSAVKSPTASAAT